MAATSARPRCRAHAVSLGFLVGDVTNSYMVSAADIAATKSRSGQAVNATTARYDVNLSGAISAQDVSMVKARAGNKLPSNLAIEVPVTPYS